MTGRDTRGACSTCKRGLVGSMTREDEEDRERSAISMYYSIYVGVLKNVYLPFNSVPYTQMESLGKN